MLLIDTRKIHGLTSHEITVVPSNKTINNQILIDGYPIAEIDWKVSEEEISELLDYLSDDAIFATRINKALINIVGTLEIDEASLPKIRKFVSAGIPKSLAAMIIILNNSEDLSLETIAEIAKHSVVQMDDKTKQSTLEMIYVLSRRMPVANVLQVFKDYGQTLSKQKQAYEALVSLPDEIISNVNKFNNTILNFIINYADFLMKEILKNERTMEILTNSFNKIEKQNYEDFEIYYRIFQDLNYDNITKNLSKEYGILENEVLPIVSAIRNSNPDLFAYGYSRYRATREEEIKVENRKNYFAHFTALVFTAYGVENFVKAYENIRDLNYPESNLTLDHIIALVEYENEYGGEMSPRLIFNIAGIPQLES